MPPKKTVSRKRTPKKSVDPIVQLRALPQAIRTGLWSPWGFGLPRKEGAKPPKIPKYVAGHFGSAITQLRHHGSDDPTHWVDFDTAVTTLETLLAHGTYSPDDPLWRWEPAGMGRLCSSDPELWVLDLDNCVVNSKLNATASDFVKRAATYTEISPSGTGLRLAFLGSRPPKLGAAEFGTIGDMKVESYDQASTRYVTFTGTRVGDLANVAKPSAAFSKWFVANWKGSVGSTKSGTAVSTPANLAAIAALMRIATGEDRSAQIVPIRVDYTQVPDASAEFAYAIREAAKLSRDARVILASAIDATGDDRQQKGTRPLFISGQRIRVPMAIYDLYRVLGQVAATNAAKAAVKSTLLDKSLTSKELADRVVECVDKFPDAMWHITYYALKGLKPERVAELTGQDLATVNRIRDFGGDRDGR